MKTRSSLSRFLFPLMLTTLAACASVQMDVPTPLGSAPEMPVAGRQGWSRLTGKPMTFGAFRAEEIHLGWRSTRRETGPGWAVRSRTKEYSLGEERERSRQRLEFRLTGVETEPLWVRCLRAEDGEFLVFTRRAERREDSMDLREERESSFGCSAVAETGETFSWSLALGTSDPRRASGTLTLGEATFAIDSSNWVNNGKRVPAPVGFVVRSQDGPVAAVELVDQGTVWIAPELEPADRAALAGAAAALLLYDQSG